ncbi:amino acid ABC transporter permease [Paracoccus nototheniae]|uniref:Amino acid ABC transporter permease n=1 Tax=Paracoccus nototheniae TaxID=2489002 RepID=A0ABW4DX42_9RHOB|nr:amino acid ABC transporter permease [Paracoccus nototheniae]
MISPRPAPPVPHRPILKLLLGDAVSAVITLCTLGMVVLLLPAFNWAVLDAVWSGSEGQDACRAGGACWAYLHDKARLILFGIYPPDQQWRPVVVIGLIVAMVLASLSPRLWNIRLALVWAAAIAVILLLMRGGILGLAPVQTAKWGGLPVTLLLAVVSLGLGFPLAVMLALGRQSDLPVVKAMSVCVIELVRGLPLVGLLFVAAILLPLLLPAGWTIDKLGRTVAALTIFAAAYLAEVLRGGLQGLGPGQAEAARALGIPYWKMIGNIILPQAIQKVIPPLTNTAIVMVKNTSLVMIVGVFDMLGAGRAAAGDPAWPAPFTETYLFVAALYFAICFSISIYARWLERRVKARSYA